METPAPTPKPALLVSGAPVTQPLWAGLSETYHLVFAHPQAAQVAREVGIASASALADYLTGDAKESADNDAALLTARVVNALPDISRRVGATVAPTGPVELNGRFGAWFAGYVQFQMAQFAQMFACLDLMAARERLAGCLVHEDVTPMARALVGWFRARELPSVHLPHAACHLLPGVADIHRETRADYVLASGGYMAQFYAAVGVPEDRIRIVGVPAWDGLYTGLPPGKAEARRVLKIDNARVILYGASWPQTTSLRGGGEAEAEAAWRAVLALAHAWEAVVMCSVHPNDGRPVEQYYAETMKAAGVPGLVTRFHTNYLVRAADVLIAQGPSNFCVSTAIQGLPSCYIQTEGFDFAHPLPPRADADGLKDAAEAALAEGLPWDEFATLYNAAHETRGGATEKAVVAVKEICRW